MKHAHSTAGKGIFYLVLSAFLYSIMPVAIRFLGRENLTPISQVFLRYIFAFLAAFVYFFFIKRTSLQVKKNDWVALFIATIVGYALTNLFFTYGIMYTQVGNALFLFYSYTILTPVLAYLMLREKMNIYNVISVCISLVALILLFQPNSVPTWKIGGLFAILSAVGQSFYLILRKKLTSYPAGFMMIANTFIGVVVMGILSLVMDTQFYTGGAFAALSPRAWFVTFLFGLDNFLAWFAMTKGFEYFKAASGSLILLSELVFGIIFAFLFFAEIPTLLTAVGGVLILAAISAVVLKGAA